MEPEGPIAAEAERLEPRQTPGTKATWRQYLSRGVVPLVAVAISGVVLVGLFSDDAPPRKPSAPPSPPERGVACPELQRAAQKLEAEDGPGFARLVLAAARTGEAALERSGEIFGRPEDLALNLAWLVEAGARVRNPRVAQLMNQIRAACVELDRWT